MERNIDRLPVTSTPTRDLVTTQACTLTGNRTSNLSLCGRMLNQLSHTNQGRVFMLFKTFGKESK